MNLLNEEIVEDDEGDSRYVVAIDQVHNAGIYVS